MPRSLTIGQQIQTTVQLTCGLLSLVSAITCFYWKRLRRFVRIAWMFSFTAAAGLSSLVWGPPMLTVALVFAIVVFFMAIGIMRLLRIAGA